MNLVLDLSTCGITQGQRNTFTEKLQDALTKLGSGKEDFTGWVDAAGIVTPGEMDDIEETAKAIREKCDLFIVVGIGGSYLGAQAVMDALFCGQGTDGPKVVFAGCNMSGAYHRRILEMMDGCDCCLCVISKSGTTTEPLAAFSILKEKMEEKYGAQASSRIYAVTDREKGRLREEADEAGYRSFVVPDDIGGRYSVLSAVGLLPLAVAGVDIRSLTQGAVDLMTDEEACEAEADYALTRVALSMSGKWIEVFEYFHPELHFFGEWLKQLFGESEGKERKGIFPASLMFSRDLHSMGQFIQQGKPLLFETVIIIDERNEDVIIPESAGAPLAGKSIEQINDCAIKGVAAAHTKAGVPVIKLHVPKMDAYNMGQLIYFFEMSCAIAAYTMGVCPFDQPGVEAYKQEMRDEIAKIDG